MIGKVYAFELPPLRYYRIFVHGSVGSVVILVFLFSYNDSWCSAVLANTKPIDFSRELRELNLHGHQDHLVSSNKTLLCSFIFLCFASYSFGWFHCWRPCVSIQNPPKAPTASWKAVRMISSTPPQKKCFMSHSFRSPSHIHTHMQPTHCRFCDITAKQQNKVIILEDWELAAVKTNASLNDRRYLRGVTLHCLCKRICVCAMPRVGRCQTSLSGRNAGLFTDTGPSFSRRFSQSH